MTSPHGARATSNQAGPTSQPRSGLSQERRRAVAAGAALDAEEALLLLERAPERARLAHVDPSALFAVLGALPVSTPPRPSFAHLLPQRHGARWTRVAVASAAALGLAAAGLFMLSEKTSVPSELRAAAVPLPEAVRTRSLPPLVQHVSSPSARVVTLVPPSADGPSVTLIVDDGIDL